MSLLEIFITYLSIGSAFAMRAHFLNRRRPVLTRIRAVVGHFLLWLPILLLRLVRWCLRVQRAKRTGLIGGDPEFDSRIEGVLSCFLTRHKRNQVREVLERYAALHAALADAGSRATGQFELFAIAGNGNGSTGTNCLYRKNLSKLRDHKSRTTEDLIGLALTVSASPSTKPAVSELYTFFDSFGDRSAIKRLESLNTGERISDQSSFRIAA